MEWKMKNWRKCHRCKKITFILVEQVTKHQYFNTYTCTFITFSHFFFTRWQYTSIHVSRFTFRYSFEIVLCTVFCFVLFFLVVFISFLNKKAYKFDYILRELRTCNNPYRSSISRNEYSFAWAGLCIGTGGCICDAPVLGGPVVIVLHDSYAEHSIKDTHRDRNREKVRVRVRVWVNETHARTHKHVKNKQTSFDEKIFTHIFEQ